MRTALKVAVAALPFALVFLVIRWAGRGEAERWRERVGKDFEGAVVGVEEEDLIVLASDREEARAAGAEVRDFRHALAATYGDLLGTPRFERMVVVVFPDVRSLQAFAGADMRADRDATRRLHGYTDPVRGAVFVPAEALKTLRHETVHWVMETARSATTAQNSPWLSEGLAQLFATFVPPRPPHVDRLALSGPFDVDRLIRIEDYGRFLEEGERNYTEALALAAFLFEARPDGLREYMAAERRSAEGRPLAFRQIFRHDDEPFRREFAAFIAGLR